MLIFVIEKDGYNAGFENCVTEEEAKNFLDSWVNDLQDAKELKDEEIEGFLARYSIKKREI